MSVDSTAHADDAAPPLAPARTHEVYGAASRAFAAVQAALRDGPVLWIQDLRAPCAAQAALDGFGLVRAFDPARLVVVRAGGRDDALWCFEEALRSGAASLVVGELDRPTDLTAGRRLNLAAEAGAERAGGRGPVGLAVVAAAAARAGGAAETRWRAEPAPSWSESPDAPPRWVWTLEKNKRGRTGAWTARLFSPDLARAAVSLLDPAYDAATARPRLVVARAAA